MQGADPAVGCVRNPLIVCILPEWAAWIVGSLPERSLFLRENAGKVRCGSPECAGSGRIRFWRDSPCLPIFSALRRRFAVRLPFSIRLSPSDGG